MVSNLHTCSQCVSIQGAAETMLENWWIGPSVQPVAPQHRQAVSREHVPLGAVSAAAWAELHAWLAGTLVATPYRMVADHAPEAHGVVHLLAGRPMGWPPG